MNQSQHSAHSSRYSRLYVYSWALIFYTVLIIAWGAWVRISGSGDGCGDHWPLCNGSAVPLGAAAKTWVEVSHRYSTALFGLLVILQLLAIRRYTPTSSSARRWVWFTVLFTITEALIGRALVKYGLVNDSQSLYRLIAMPLHLVNTSLLLGAEVVTAESLCDSTCQSRYSRRKIFQVGAGVLLLLTSGAIAALGSHLMPSASLVDGISHDLHPGAHPAVRLRLLHPLLGLLLPATFWWIANYGSGTTNLSVAARASLRTLNIALFLTVMVGVATLGMLSPVWLKLLHLTLANIVVIFATRCAYCFMRR